MMKRFNSGDQPRGTSQRWLPRAARSSLTQVLMGTGSGLCAATAGPRSKQQSKTFFMCIPQMSRVIVIRPRNDNQGPRGTPALTVLAYLERAFRKALIYRKLWRHPRTPTALAYVGLGVPAAPPLAGAGAPSPPRVPQPERMPNVRQFPICVRESTVPGLYCGWAAFCLSLSRCVRYAQ